MFFLHIFRRSHWIGIDNDILKIHEYNLKQIPIFFVKHPLFVDTSEDNLDKIGMVLVLPLSESISYIISSYSGIDYKSMDILEQSHS